MFYLYCLASSSATHLQSKRIGVCSEIYVLVLMAFFVETYGAYEVFIVCIVNK